MSRSREWSFILTLDRRVNAWGSYTPSQYTSAVSGEPGPWLKAHIGATEKALKISRQKVCGESLHESKQHKSLLQKCNAQSQEKVAGSAVTVPHAPFFNSHGDVNKGENVPSFHLSKSKLAALYIIFSLYADTEIHLFPCIVSWFRFLH